MFSDVQSIDFTSLETTSQEGKTATVAFQTTSHRTSVTESCSGSANLVADKSGGWLVDQLVGINCS